MKAGDKIYLKNINEKSEMPVFFTITSVSDWGEPGLEVIDIEVPWDIGRKVSFSTTGDNRFLQFSDYFYTPQELRKLKLQKLNEKN